MAPLGDDEGSFIVKERLIPRKYADIPKDQHKLLSRPDAWNTKGIPNLPSKVLENVQKAYVRRLRLSASSEPATPKEKDPTTVKGPPRHRNGHSKHGTDKNGKHGRGSDGTDDDDDEEPIPWTPSPTYHKQAPVRQDDLPTLRPDDRHPPSSSPVRPSRRPPPPSSPARPSSPPAPSSAPLPARQVSPTVVEQTPARKAGGGELVVCLKSKAAQQAPPSSLASEPDLEYQPPRAITDVVAPVDRTRRSTRPPPPARRVLRSMQRPAPTPPSAQEPVTVPCTWKEPSSSEKRQQTADEPANKRRRLHKPPPFESSQPVVAVDSAAPPSGSRADPVDLKDSQTSNSSSGISMIPGTPGRRQANVVRRRGSGSKAYRGGQSLAAVIQLDEEGSDGSHAPVKPGQGGLFSSSGRLPPNGPASQAPFVAFKMAYPTYNGTVGDFVRAALNIVQLQESHSLAEFLYDDFIRVWADYYVDYVEDCLKDNRKPLKAIQWYNEYVPRPVFTKRIFTKGNITDIMEHHRPEAESYRREIAHPSNISSSLPAATSPASPVTSRSAHQDLALARQPSNYDGVLPPAGTPPLVAAMTGGQLPGSPTLLPKGPGSAQPIQPVPHPSVEMHDIPRPDQIERIEPLRSVPGYVVTMSQHGPSRSERANDQPDPPAVNPPQVKHEEPEEPSLLLTKSPLRSSNDAPSQSPAAPASTNQHRPSAPKQPEAPTKHPSPARSKSPLPSFGEILTQPPATALSFISDFTKSVIPETAIKPKDGPLRRLPSPTTRVPLAVDSENQPPASSAAPTSSAARRRKLSKAERFVLFLQKRQAQSSASKSTVE